MACTRPDLGYFVISLSQFNSRFRERHWQLAKKFVRYIKSTKYFRLVFSVDGEYQELIGLDDAAFGNNKEFRSTIGYCIFLHGGVINGFPRDKIWCQFSTAKSEYVVLSLCARKLVNFARLVFDVQGREISEVKLLMDNQRAMTLLKDLSSV